ncbi:GMC family oxidoreductase [Methylocystis parvus]|uniref:GMC family oxidoreductase n=1 Tax=Methylocystis parvus TaxID=134 RepID=UPI003C737C7B
MDATVFDYIIVGGGSAGCVLASRLSEDPDCRVLLLEAGGESDSPLVRTPAAYGSLQDSVFDWGDRTPPQAALNGRRIFVPQGRALGGSSAINYMIYIRGNRADYDQWAEEGARGWSYEDVSPYFRKSEGNRNFSDRFHNTEGPLAVVSHHPNPLVERYIAAGQEIGLPFNPDFNGETQEGCGPLQATLARGERCSAAEAFLTPARSRKNLTILTHARATRLRFEARRAVGVDYIRLGSAEAVRAEREVILSAGALRSPQLLMLSGVGPRAELEKMGIDVRIELPGVGKNLQDHLHTRVRCEITQPLTFGGLADAQKDAARRQYEVDRSGPLASNMLEAGAFVRLQETRPELQLFLLAQLAPDYPEAGPVNRHGLTFTAYINRPQSRGAVSLASSDPLDRPLIDFNYLAHPGDMRLAVAGVRCNLRLLYARAFDDIRGSEIAPGITTRSDEEIEAFVRRTASTTWHPVGTCRMGDDDMAVVDHELRLREAASLRVVDASVMPTIVGGNTNAPVIMISEKAADMIRGRHAEMT